MKMGKVMVLAAALALPALVLGGCPKKEGKDGKNAAKTAAEAEAAKKEALGEIVTPPLEKAEPPRPEKPPEDKPDPLKDIMKPVCDRMLAEYKAAHPGQTITENLEKGIQADCRVMALAFKGSSKAAEATTAYADHITRACLTKKAQEWIDCFSKEQAGAGSAANDVIMGK